MGSPEVALKFATRAIASRPSHTASYVEAARASFWMGQLEQAINLAEEGLAKLNVKPEDAHIHVVHSGKANISAKAKLCNIRHRAIALMDGFEPKERGTVAYRLGDALAGIVQTNEAIAQATTGHVDASLYSNRCAMLVHVAEASTPATYAAALKLTPPYDADELAGALTCVFAAVSKGQTQGKQQPPSRADWLRAALVDARTCHQARPSWFRANLRVATCLSKMGRASDAKATLEEALVTVESEHRADIRAALDDLKSQTSDGTPEHADPKAAADAKFAAKEYKAAVTLYRRAIEQRPRDAVLHSNLSAALCGMGNYAEAAASARTAITCDPRWGKAYLRLGTALHFANNLEDAYCVYMKGFDVASSAGESSRTVASKCQSAAKSLLRIIPKEVSSSVASWRDEWFRRDAQRDRKRLRIFVTSDLHVDQHGNISWCDRISSTAFRNDILIVAGDVGDTANAVKICMRKLSPKFRRVFYCAGNHDLWIRPDTSDEYPDSICKLFSLENLCETTGQERGSVTMRPMEVARGVFVVPLNSWYHYTFDTYHPKPGGLLYDKFCKWPVNVDDVAEYMLALNGWRLNAVEKRIEEVRKEGLEPVVISFSHFLPRVELPYPHGCDTTEMAKAVGCLELEDQVARLGSQVHVYGHTHINGDGPCGVNSERRYVQYALEGGGSKLYCIYDNGILHGKEVWE